MALGHHVEGLADYPNVPGVIGQVISCGRATLHELQTVYSLEDVYDLLEIVMVDAHNARIVRADDEKNRNP